VIRNDVLRESGFYPSKHPPSSNDAFARHVFFLLVIHTAGKQFKTSSTALLIIVNSAQVSVALLYQLEKCSAQTNLWFMPAIYVEEQICTFLQLQAVDLPF